MKRIYCYLMAAILVIALPNNVRGRTYNFSSLSYPGAGMTGSYGMNDLGQVVGEYFVSGDIYPKGFIYTSAESHGTYTPFTVKDAISTTLNDINNAGDLVGAYRGTTGKFPFLYAGGVLTDIVPPGATGGQARSINKYGVIVGDCQVGSKSRGFKYVNRDITFVDHPDGAATHVNGINDQGTMVGQFFDQDGVGHGFILKNGIFTTIDFPGATETRANGINNSEQVVGYYSLGDGVTHGFVSAPGLFTKVDRGGGGITEISDINRFGKIVGYSEFDGFLALPVIVPPLQLLLD